MMSDEQDSPIEGECTIHSHPVPADELSRYSVESDLHAERDIANYVEGQAPDEIVQHVERIKKEIVLGDVYEIWDVTTDKDRWWVITNLTNLYSQKHFPTLDYTISFHIGLMMRLRSRPDRIDSSDPTPFDEVFRRMDQADARHAVARGIGLANGSCQKIERNSPRSGTPSGCQFHRMDRIVDESSMWRREQQGVASAFEESGQGGLAAIELADPHQERKQDGIFDSHTHLPDRCWSFDADSQTRRTG
jgi:hypothetical protein